MNILNDMNVRRPAVVGLAMLLFANGAAQAGLDDNIFRQRDKLIVKPETYNLVFNKLCVSSNLTLSVRNRLSTVITCDTFTTDSRGRPEERDLSVTLPGAMAKLRLEVMTTATTV